MSVYLPVAEISQNILILLMLGGGIGFLSGMFGVGGGFLLTPLLILLGIPPAVAVASGANQVLGSSFSGFLAHWRRRMVDVRMGGILVLGGLVGSTAGMGLNILFRQMGQIDLIVHLAYLVLLGVVGGLMLRESLRVVAPAYFGAGVPVRRKRHGHGWMQGLPLKMRFPASRLYISVIPPVLVGAVVGILSAVMGVGGGFIMIPAMIYLLEMPTQIVVGTSLFQIVLVTANVTFLQAWHTQTVDIPLVLILMVGGVIGAQWGARMGRHLRGEYLRLLLAIMVLGMGLEMGFELTITPQERFTLESSAP